MIAVLEYSVCAYRPIVLTINVRCKHGAVCKRLSISSAIAHSQVRHVERYTHRAHGKQGSQLPSGRLVSEVSRGSTRSMLQVSCMMRTTAARARRRSSQRSASQHQQLQGFWGQPLRCWRWRRSAQGWAASRLECWRAPMGSWASSPGSTRGSAAT
jgi:hypothetical protein